MAQIARAVEVNAPVETIEEQWQRFEDHPRCAAHTLTVNVRWRAEVLTFEPIRTGTRITLKVEYEPGGAEAGLPDRLEAVLQGFVSFLELRRGCPLAAQPA
ncbi:MAG TPA: hypothetical protein VF841_09710 [Anaeromyxobacter sp.]